MGLLDKLKKKNNLQPENQIKKDYDIQYGITRDGRLQVDFYDMQADFKQFYDTTRLILSQRPLNLAGKEVYNCLVSWYGQNDCSMLNERTGEFEILNAVEYRGVLAQIDLQLLKSDPEYCKKVMKSLLDKQRVEKYLQAGLEEMPERPCGKYIGGVMKTEKGYRKFFSQEVGKASHYSNLMINRRKEYKENLEIKKQKEIKRREDKIKTLQEEINNMSR